MNSKALSILVLAMSIAGCSGGGSSGNQPAPPTAPPVNPPAPVAAFSDMIDQAGISRAFVISTVNPDGSMSMPDRMGGGLAAADVDADGDIDLYLVAGDGVPNQLYRNDGDNRFTEIAATVGLDMVHKGSGPAFGDIDGDGDLDLFVGSVRGDAHYLMRQDAGTFVDVTAVSGIAISAANTFSASFSDYDMDGDLDLALAHWGNPGAADTETLWENNGDGTFFSASIPSGVAGAILTPALDAPPGSLQDYSFAPTFTDLDNDADPDLVIAADFQTSQVFRNNGDGTFDLITDRDVFQDDSGMGSAVGDYDNDGDMDWFVTAIMDDPSPTDPYRGNHLYRNNGDGSFENVSAAAGIADGGWGWGACMQDFDNDGDLDIFHVNGFDAGFVAQKYLEDQVRYFESQGDGTFVERASELGLSSTGQGRGLGCFDSDRDGDIDIFISNNDHESDADNFYVNNLDSPNHYLGIQLDGCGTNTACIGARIEVSDGATTQVREIRAGNNYVSQNPAEAHFGLGDSAVVEVHIRWPDGVRSDYQGVSANQFLTLTADALNQ